MKLFTRDKSFYKSLVTLAIPVALQNLVTFLVGFADNLMISPLGDSAVSGVYTAGTIQTLLQVFNAGLEGAVLILAAQYWGKKEMPAIRRIVSIGLKCSLLFGAIIAAVCALFPAFVIGLFTKDASVIADGAEYLRILSASFLFFCATQSLIAALRSVEDTRPGLIVSLISLVINVSLNWLLIGGKWGFPALGIKGAAIATVVARVFEFLFILLYLVKIDKTLKLTLPDLKSFDRTLFRDFVKYGLPVVAGQLVWAVNLLANTAILGRFGETTLTAASVANTMNTLAFVAVNGLSAAVGIIIGKTIGAGKTELIREYSYTVQILFFALGLLSGGLIFCIRRPFVGLYRGITVEAVKEAIRFLNVLSVTFIGTCYECATLFGLVKSGGDVGFVFKNDTIFVFLVVLPSAIIASLLGAPSWVVFACLKCDQILKCFVAVVKINRFNWMKNLTRANAES